MNLISKPINNNNCYYSYSNAIFLGRVAGFQQSRKHYGYGLREGDHGTLFLFSTNT